MGHAAKGKWPTKWNGSDGANIVWKVDLPKVGEQTLRGMSSPVVWSNRIFMTFNDQAKDTGYVVAFSTVDGKQLWKREYRAIKHQGLNLDHGLAVPTPVTDGERVYAAFSDGQVVALTVEGKPLWKHHHKIGDSMYGFAASLAYHDGKVIYQLDHGDGRDGSVSRLIAFNGKTGRIAWETRRQDLQTWSSPVVVGDLILTCGSKHLAGYDAKTGKQLWKCEGLGGDVAPSPVAADGVAYAVTEYAYLFAVKLGGKGDVGKTHRLWGFEDELPDVVSPLVADGKIIMISSAPYLTAVDIKTGKRVWEVEFVQGCNASPVLANGLVYLFDVRGKCTIFKPGAKYEVVATPSIPDKIDATPAFVGGRIYIRGKKQLWCIGAK